MTIADIKKEMTDAFIANKVVQERYGLRADRGFDEQFSKVSLENIIFSVVATAMWFNAKLFAQHKADVLQLLKENRAHTTEWYATRAKEFQFGSELVVGTDQYDNSTLTDEQIEEQQIIKFAASMESANQSYLFIKVATENEGIKQPLNEKQLQALKTYLGKIKDAGVRIKVINEPADFIRLKLDIYYNPMILDVEGKRLDGSDDTPVQSAIEHYISTLSFNGLYVNQSLVDSLQVVEGVEIAELKEASSRYGALVEYRPIDARSVPYAGYYQIAEDDLMLNFIPNE